jgi:Calcineurin-like phosphoesterase
MANTNALVQGPNGQVYSEPAPAPDEVSFQVDNNSEEYYNSPYYEAHKNQLQPVPDPRGTDPLKLEDFVPASITSAITSAKRISFHAVGDTGAAKTASITNEAHVADAMAADLAGSASAAPAFFFHLGDVVYSFGEGQYYYDQFYEPFRAYGRPIFAIPGNHDGQVFGDAPDTPNTATLVAFLRNFCATAPAPSPDAGGMSRTTMTQPGVYFSLDAPFVSIIGLYTNVLEGPGVISTQGNHYPAPMTDDQLTFLTNELKRLNAARNAGDARAIVLACHHPPASVDAKHGGGSGLSADIDSACEAAACWPDAILSGHAHLYQRYTRTHDGREIPYVVAGSGGYAATMPQGGLPPAPVTVGEFTLVAQPIVQFGYLTLTVDMTSGSGTLAIRWTGTAGRTDAVTVDLGTHTIRSQQVPG